MRILDANLLLYAVNGDAPLHAKAKRWMERTLSESARVGFEWTVLLAFVRLSTRSAVFPRPLAVSRAFDLVQDWLSQPCSEVVLPGPRHLTILRGLLEPFGAAGNLTADAHLASVAIEHGAEICSCDGDFARFPGVRWLNPLR